MKGTDFIQVMEYVTKLKGDKPKRARKEKDIPTELLLALLMKDKESSVTDLLHKKLEETDTLRKFLADFEKANKKEEKKDDKKKDGMSAAQIAVFLVMLFPITAPLYVAFVRALFH